MKPPIPENEKLKKLYNAFSTLPLDYYHHARDREFYVDCQKVRGDTDIIHDLGRPISWSPTKKTTCQLYAGHRGAGKSTELMRLRRHLEKEGYYVVYFAADEGDIDPEDTRYTDILLACVRQLLSSLKKTDPKPLITWLKQIKTSLKELPNYEVDISPKLEISSFFGKLTANLRASPTARKKIRDEIDSHTGSLLEALNKFIGEAFHSGIDPNKLVLIVDNLDRIVPAYNDTTNRTNHSEIFIDRSEQLTALKCHVIYTVPISLVYSEQGTQLQDCHYENIAILPMVNISKRGQAYKPNPVGLQVFHKLLDKRTQVAANLSIHDVFYDEQLITQLCLKSGGHLRDLMHLVRGTLRYLPQFNDIHEATLRSISKMKETYLNSINNQDWIRLAEVHLKQEMRNEQEYRNLLFNRSILEYRELQIGNGEKNPKWQDVHPLILEIDQFNAALDLLKQGGNSNG